MGTKLSEMIKRLPKARRGRIAARAQEIKNEIEALKSRVKPDTRPRT